MTVVLLSHISRYTGVSTDTKPTAPLAGSTFRELDTGAEYLWSGTAWRQLTQHVSMGDTASTDAFSRLRTSNPVTIFAAQEQYNIGTLLFETGATGTGVAPAHSVNTRMVALSCTAGSGTSFIQTYEYIPYQPGKSQLIFVTGVMGAGVTGAVTDVGLFDASNGFMFRQSGTALQFVRRSKTSGSVVDVPVAQADWNLDTLDGTGPSGITLDAEKAFILVIDAQFLGMGRVRIGFDIGGQIVLAHEFLHANVLSVPYMQTLTLPVQMLITATTTASTKTAQFKCVSVSSEGGLESDLAYQFATPDVAVTAGSGTRTAAVSIRPLTTFNTIPNRAKFALASVDVLVTGAQPVEWELGIGATFSAAPTWAAVSAAHSAFEYTSAPGTLTALGTVIAAGFIPATNQSRGVVTARTAQRYPITLDRAGAVRADGTLTLSLTGIGGTSACRAMLNYSEIR